MAADGVVELSTKLDSAGAEAGASKLGSAISGGLKVGVAALAAVGTAVIAIGTSAVKAYANYEQLVGGVDTLFKENSALVQQYADDAYKTAGLTANAYMSTVTAFSASLLQGLGGDTKQAAETANMAIVDMADNANKMGSDMALVQSAYQGFAKQQYILLDNLKLGYGGTKTEMERLLVDAEKISGIKYDISNLDDVYQAIHVIQTELGITGTTAKEASSTLQGSAAMMRSAWGNMLVGLADSSQDFDKLLQNLIESAGAFAAQLIPRIEITLSGIAKLAEALVPQIAETIPRLLAQILPSVAATGVGVIQALLSGITENLPALMDGAIAIVEQLVGAIYQAIPLIVVAAMQLIAGFATGLADFLPKIVPMWAEMMKQLIQGVADNLPLMLDAVGQFIEGFATALTEGIPMIIEVILSIIDLLPEMITMIIESLLSYVGVIVEAGIALFTALITALPVIIEAIVAILPEIITAIINALVTLFPLIIETGISLFASLIDALPDIIDAIISVLPEIVDAIITAAMTLIPLIIQAGIDLFVALVTALPQIITEIVTVLPKIVLAVVTALLANLPLIIKAGIDLFVALIRAAPEIIVTIVKLIPQIVAGIVKELASLVGQMVTAGFDLIKGLWKGIGDAAAWLWGKISGFLAGIMDRIKDFFGIASPSTLFTWIGEMLDRGLGGGIEKNANIAIGAAADMAKGVADAMLIPETDVLTQIDALTKKVKTGVAHVTAEANLAADFAAAKQQGNMQNTNSYVYSPNNYYTMNSDLDIDLISRKQAEQVEKAMRGMGVTYAG